MNRFKKFLSDTNSIKQERKNWVKRYRLAAPIAILGLMPILTAQAQNRDDAVTP